MGLVCCHCVRSWVIDEWFTLQIQSPLFQLKPLAVLFHA